MRRHVDSEINQEWEKDITEEDYLKMTGEAYSRPHGNQSKLQAVASKLQLVESCSCPASHLPQENNMLLSVQLFAHACPGIPGRGG